MSSTLALFLMTVLTLGVLGICWAIIEQLMRPIILQRVREAKCQHAFETKVYNSEGIVFETRFCPRCGGVRVIAAGHQAGIVKQPEKERPRLKAPAQRRGKL